MHVFRRVISLLPIGAFLLIFNGASAGEPLKRDFQECSECPQMVVVPGGKFEMGSPATERGRFDAEGPRHLVSVRAFAIGKYAVTVAEFLIFLRETGYQPSTCDSIQGLRWQSPGRGRAYAPSSTEPPLWPAICLGWKDAEAYIGWLNGKVRGLPSVGKRGDGPYRLPSEAEWEYVARGGTTTARWWGEEIGRGNANCNGCGSEWDGHLIAPVGSFGPNPLGLYDMLGNVWQWVSDCWNESYVGAPSDGSSRTRGDCRKRVMRGGSWSNVPALVRSASRGRADVAGEDLDNTGYVGFRVARNLP